MRFIATPLMSHKTLKKQTDSYFKVIQKRKIDKLLKKTEVIQEQGAEEEKKGEFSAEQKETPTVSKSPSISPEPKNGTASQFKDFSGKERETKIKQFKLGKKSLKIPNKLFPNYENSSESDESKAKQKNYLRRMQRKLRKMHVIDSLSDTNTF